MDDDTIAVVGMAGRFPQAPDIERYWENLRDGRDCIADLADSDLLRWGEDPELLRHPAYVRRRPLIPEMAEFDAQYFGMTRRDADIRDPQHRIFLETCHSAFDHAGYDPAAYEGSVGVYAGLNSTRYDDLYLRSRPEVVRTAGELAIETSNHPDYLTSFVAYKLGLRGPALTVATACSTSLVAVHLACQALHAGDCDMAIAGGVEVEWPYGLGYLHVPGGIYSSDGYCRPFDAHASGTVFGSGAGAVLLKRYSDAVADGDTVYAVVLGTAVNNDGSDKLAFSAPSVTGQLACVAEALAAADVDPATLSYVEAHGTATKLGDPVEVHALTQAFERFTGPGATGYCGIGSVKSNVGHLGPAAGVAGFLKTVLALHHELIPPSINYTEPNPELDLERSPFYVVDKATPWPREADRPRRAGCSSFGIGGTNAHVVVQEAPPQPARRLDDRPQLVVWSGKTPEALQRLSERLTQHVTRRPVALPDLAHTLMVGRKALPHRAAAVLTEPAEFVVQEGHGNPTPVVLVFPGQGAQSPGMARGLHAALPAFAEPFDRCLAAMSDLTGLDLAARWLDGDVDETLVAQPLLFAVEYAMAAALRELGCPVGAVLGHSVGELVAGTVAGALSEEDALRLVTARATAMQVAPRGVMIAVAGGEQDVLPHLTDGVAIAAVNGRRQVVLSGPEQSVRETQERLAAAGVAGKPLATSHAFHSPDMAEAAETVRSVAAGIRWRTPEIPLASGLTGELERDRLTTPDFWADQLVRPVRFFDAATALFRDHQGTVVIEAGPGDTVTRLLRTHPTARRSGCTFVAPLRGSDDYVGYLNAVAELWRAGHDLDLRSVAPRNAVRVAVPGYPFARDRHFVDRPTAQEAVTAPVPAQESRVAPPVVAQEVPAAAPARGPSLVEVGWVAGPTAPVVEPSGPAQPALTLLPAGERPSRRVVSILQRSGLRPVPLAAADREALFAAIGELARQRKLPDCVVHALSFGDEGPDDQELDQGFHRLRWLVQAVQRHRAEAGLRSWRLVVLTRRAAEVGGGEPVNPVRAMLLGLLRTADLEIDSLDVQLVDVGERASNDTVVEAIRLRLPVVAVRGTRVLRPALLPVADGAAQNRLRRRGVYLITGGLGALGAVCARALADTGLTPRLALVGRSGMDTPGADRLVAELTAAGAEVQVIAADIGDPTAAADVLATVRDRFGPVNGVVHAAGVAGDGLIELRTDDQVAAVLRAKVGGGRVLTDLLADEPDVDWMVHFSSRAALSGLVGSGDYAAANAYLDALARGSDDGDRRVVSVAWPAWSGAGMASGLPDAESDEVVVERTLTGEEWFLAEHRVDGVPVLSGTTYIDLLAEAVRERGLVPGDAALAVRDLKFLAPLTVPADTEVQLRLRPDGGSHRVVVRSRAAGQREWTTHAKATVAAADSAPQHVRLDVLHADWADAEPAAFGGRGLLQLGPRWDNVVRRVCRGDEQLVELRLGDAHRDDVQRHQAHPALLDNATSSVNLAGGEGPYIPVGYRELVLHQRIPADVVVVVGPVTRAGDRLTGDIDIYNQRGRHVAHITGFTMQVVPPDVFAHPAPEPAGGATGQLSPEDGAELFLRVIQSSVPAHVAVLPAGAAPVPHHVYTVAGETVVAPPPAPRPVEVAPAPVTPVTTGDVLTRLQRIWQDLVGDPEIGLDDDFFDIGGTSLSAVQLVSMVRDELGVEIGVGLIFEKSTLRDLSGELERLGAS